MLKAMVDGKPVSGSNVNWPLAIAISVLLHAGVLGVFMLGSSGPADGARTASAQARQTAAADGAGGGDDATADADVRSGSPDAGGEESTTAAPAVPDTYTVKSGDNLTKIAKHHGCTAENLAALNGFDVNKPLAIGERLKVPASARQ